MPRINYRSKKGGTSFATKSTRKKKANNDNVLVSKSTNISSSSFSSNIATRSNSNQSNNLFESSSSIHANARCKTQSMNLQNEYQYNTYRRVCYCDRGERPKDCNECSQFVS